MKEKIRLEIGKEEVVYWLAFVFALDFGLNLRHK